MAQIVTVAGIDVSKGWLDVALWPDDTITRHVDREAPDWADKLATWLTEHQVGRVGLEASGGYEIEVMDALQARGFVVIRFRLGTQFLLASARTGLVQTPPLIGARRWLTSSG